MFLGFQPISILFFVCTSLPVTPGTFEPQNVSNPTSADLNDSEINSTEASEHSKYQSDESENVTTASSIKPRLTFKKPKLSSFRLAPRPIVEHTNKISEEEEDDKYVANVLAAGRVTPSISRAVVQIVDDKKETANTSAFSFTKSIVFMNATYMKAQTDVHKAEILGYVNTVRRSLGVANLNFMHWSRIGEILANLQARLQCGGVKMEEFGHELLTIKAHFGHIYHVTSSKSSTVYLPALQNWNEGSIHYFPTSNICKKSQEASCMKYLQLVWWATSEIGCSYWKCPEVDADVPRDEAHLVVCYFYPKLNFPAERPYINGPPCSRCLPRQQCLDDLCIEEDEYMKSEKYDWLKSYSHIHAGLIEKMNNLEN